MNSTIRIGVCLGLVLSACTSTRDHFYALSTLPETDRGTLTAPAVHVLLNVTVPTLVDRAEMVISTATNAVEVLDHERWAGLLSDQVSQTLARDIEQRRRDLVVADRDFDQASSPPVTITVDIVRMSARIGSRATLEAHWRIVDKTAGMDEIGGGFFQAPTQSADYAGVAQAFSQALSALAEKLAGAVHRN